MLSLAGGRYAPRGRTAAAGSPDAAEGSSAVCAGSRGKGRRGAAGRVSAGTLLRERPRGQCRRCRAPAQLARRRVNCGRVTWQGILSLDFTDFFFFLNHMRVNNIKII